MDALCNIRRKVYLITGFCLLFFLLNSKFIYSSVDKVRYTIDAHEPRACEQTSTTIRIKVRAVYQSISTAVFVTATVNYLQGFRCPNALYLT